MKNELIDWEFICQDHENYLVTLTTWQTGNIFNLLLLRSKEKLKRKGVNTNNIDTKDIVKTFDIPETYFNLLRTSITKVTNDIKHKVAQDGIKIIDLKVTNANFTKNDIKSRWDINIKIEGKYVDER